MKTISSLVWLLLAGALLILILGIGTIFSFTANAQADDSCSSSVVLRAGLQGAGINAGEITCQTEVQELAGDEEDVREGIVQAHNRCKRQFATALQNDIVAGETTFCHVCGIYESTDVEVVTGLGEALKPIPLSGRELAATDSENIEIRNTLPQTSDQLELDKPLAIIFFQDRTEEFNLLTILATKEVTVGSIGAAAAAGVTIAIAGTGVGAILLAATAAGAGGAGGYITGQALDGPESTTYSGIVIRPYEQGVFEALNCQTLR